MKKVDITSKQEQIVTYLFRFRFLSSWQLQVLLNHKSKSLVAAWLRDLINKGYIESSYDRGKAGENTKPAVFHLTPSTRKILKGREGVQESRLRLLYKENSREQIFKDHCQLVADIYLQYRKRAEEGNLEYHFLTKNELAGYESLPDPLPDAYIAIKDSPSKFSRFFLEIIDPGTKPFAAGLKLQRFIEYAESGEWADHHDDKVPAVILICPDEKIKQYLNRYLQNVLEDEPDPQFLILTWNELNRYIHHLPNKRYTVC